MSSDDPNHGRERTKSRLARDLESAGVPQWIIANARKGRYDDFDDNGFELPCVELVKALTAIGRLDLVRRAQDGEWDAAKWESDEWASLQTGELGTLIDQLKLRKP